jgi:ankyrin repeat protein
MLIKNLYRLFYMMMLVVFANGCNTGITSNNSQNGNPQSESLVPKNKSATDARKDLGQLGIEFTEENFYTYARRGDRLATGLFLAAGMQPSAGLVGAALGNHTAIAKELLALGANPSATYKTFVGQFEDMNSNCASALQFSAYNNNTDLVKDLIGKGADVNFDGGCALNAAIINGNAESAELLLNAGAKADTSTLDFAIQKKKGNIAKLLINKGIKVDLMTLAEKAIKASDSETLQFAIESGLDPNAKTTRDAPGYTKYTLLMAAVDRGNPQLVTTLLNKGADPNLCIVIGGAGLSGTKGDVCPISMAMNRSGFGRKSEVETILEKAGAICNPINAVFVENLICEPSSSRKASNIPSTSSPSPTQATAKSSESSSSLTKGFPKSSCGDNLPTDSKAYPVNFYPVYVDFNQSRLNKIKNQFCQDALQKIRENNNKEVIQVASFTDIKRANAFKDLMAKQFSSGEVGEPTVIKSKP